MIPRPYKCLQWTQGAGADPTQGRLDLQVGHQGVENCMWLLKALKTTQDENTGPGETHNLALWPERRQAGQKLGLKDSSESH